MELIPSLHKYLEVVVLYFQPTMHIRHIVLPSNTFGKECMSQPNQIAGLIRMRQQMGITIARNYLIIETVFNVESWKMVWDAWHLQSEGDMASGIDREREGVLHGPHRLIRIALFLLLFFLPFFFSLYFARKIKHTNKINSLFLK